MDQQELERIARATLRELGVVGVNLTVAPVEGHAGQWRIDIAGTKGLKIRCSQGTTVQWVREQIFEQYLAQH